MERGSSKHGPQMDDDLARGARPYVQGSPGDSRVEEWRGSETASDDDPEPRWIPEGERPDPAPGPLTGEELEARSRIGQAIPRTALPGDRQQVLAGAEELGVSPEVREELVRLPADRTYRTIYDIWQALGYSTEY